MLAVYPQLVCLLGTWSCNVAEDTQVRLWKTDKATFLDDPAFRENLKRVVGTGVVGTNKPFDSGALSNQVVDLLFAEIQDERGINIENALAALGALAGFSGQMTIREFFIKTGKIRQEDAFVVIGTKSGESYYFGDLNNEALVTNNKGQHSVWGFVSAAAQHLGASKLPDMNEIFRGVASSVGSADFGKSSLASQYAPKRPAIDLLNLFWNPVRNLVAISTTNPGSWPFILGQSAQVAMIKAKGVIDPSIAAQIVMESAISMSRIDPTKIYNAYV